MGMAWNADGNKLAYYVKENRKTAINIYDLTSRDSKTLVLETNLDANSSLGFSPDDKYISYFWRNSDNRKNVDLIDVSDGSSVLKKIFSKKQDLLMTDSGRPKDAVIWLDNERLIYENSVPFERVGTIIVNMTTGEEEKFIPYVIRPALSPNKEYLAYAVTSGRNHSIHKLNLKTGKVDVMIENIGYYVFNLSWSPDSSLLVISYLEKFQEQSLNRVAIINEDGSLITLSDQIELAEPKWLDNNNLLMVKYKSSGFIIKSKTITGLYLYNLSSRNSQLITRRIRSENYYLRPQTAQVIYQFGKNVEIIDISRIFQPKGIDILRNRLGIIAR